MKKLIIVIIATTCSLCASAQAVHEFAISGGGGLSALNYKLSSGERISGFGGDFGVGYICIFEGQWGFHIGVEAGMYNAKTEIDHVEIVTGQLRDSDGDRFDLYTTLYDYTETQKAMFLNIPVMAQFQTIGKQKFYAKAGVKIGIPVNATYSGSGAELYNQAYYSEYKNWLTEPTSAGLGTFTNLKSEWKLKLGVAVTLAIETGVKWRLGAKAALYTGAWFDYGLNNILKDQPFVNYDKDAPAAFTTNSVLPALTEKMNIMAAGVKLRLAFKSGKHDFYIQTRK